MTNPTASPALAAVVPHEVESTASVAASLPRIVNHLRSAENLGSFVALADDPEGPAEAVIVSAGYFAGLVAIADERVAGQETATRVAESDAVFAEHRAAGTAPAETDMDELFPAKG